ncbi:MAG: hypothetical protein ACREL7_08670, partial [Longimicrobiales bacterium]
RVAFNGFDLRAYFETDPRFRDRFARSPVIDTIGRYVILGRPQLAIRPDRRFARDSSSGRY